MDVAEENILSALNVDKGQELLGKCYLTLSNIKIRN